MSEITSLLEAARQGDRGAADRLFALLYSDLRRLAHSRMHKSGHLTSMDTTSLVHESFLRLKGVGALDFPDREHFLAYAARVMRSVVVDLVRSRQAERHGGGAERVTYDEASCDAAQRHDDEVLQVHDALEALARTDARLARVVELRYFGGLTEDEVAATLEVNVRTVQRDWQRARLFLSLALK